MIADASIYASIAVDGVVLGAVFALLAMGVVTIYRTTRTLNLAQGGLATLGGSLFVSLRQNGVPTVPALLATIGAGVVVGLVIGEVVGWPIRNATPTTKLVASLGVLLLVQSAVSIVFGDTPRPVPALASRHVVEVFGARILVDEIVVVGAAVAIAIALERVFNATRVGLQMRCVALDTEASALQGINVHVVTLLSWMLGVGVAFGAGVFLSDVFSEVAPLTLTLVLLQALAATLLGRIESLVMAAVGGVILAELVLFMQHFFLDITGISDLTVFGFVVVILLSQRAGFAVAERA
jgi:branched-chain amino acid transport system permease protein